MSVLWGSEARHQKMLCLRQHPGVGVQSVGRQHLGRRQAPAGALIAAQLLVVCVVQAIEHGRGVVGSGRRLDFGQHQRR